MAKWPSTPNSYPGTPKAYPASPKAYPSSTTIDSFPTGIPPEPTGTLQAVSEASTGSFTGTVTSSGLLLTSACYVDPELATITLGGTMRATGTSPPVVTLTAGTGSLTYAGNCPGIRVWIDSVAGGTARGQATFSISYDSTTTPAHSGVTTAATYSIPDGPAAGNVVNFPAGTYGTDQVWEGTVATLRSSEGNSYTFTQATASAQPVLRKAAATPDAKDALFFNGAQVLACTDAAVVALGTNDPALTVAFRAAYSSADADGMVCSFANTGIATNRRRRWGQSSNSTGREVHIVANDAGTVVTNTCNTTPITATTNAHNCVWYGAGSNGALALDVNGANETIINSPVNVGTFTPNNFALGACNDSSADTFFVGLVYRVALWASQLSAGDRTTVNTELAA